MFTTICLKEKCLYNICFKSHTVLHIVITLKSLLVLEHIAIVIKDRKAIFHS